MSSLKGETSFEIIENGSSDNQRRYMQIDPLSGNGDLANGSGDAVDMAGLLEQVQGLSTENLRLQATLKDNNSQLRSKMEELNGIKSKQEEAFQRILTQQESNKAKMQGMTSRQKELETQLEVERAEKEKLARQVS